MTHVKSKQPLSVNLGAPARELVLASASPRRAEILLRAGYSPRVERPDVDEGAAGSGRVVGIAQRLAKLKAQAVAQRFPASVVIAADTVVIFEGKSLGKPRDRAEAESMLRKLRGRVHTVVTGVAVAADGDVVAGDRFTEVLFGSYSDAEISEYIETGSPMDKAGAYGIQDTPFSPVEDYRGCYLNVVGLPLCLAGDLLDRAGVRPLGARRPVCAGHRSGGGPG